MSSLQLNYPFPLIFISPEIDVICGVQEIDPYNGHVVSPWGSDKPLAGNNIRFQLQHYTTSWVVSTEYYVKVIHDLFPRLQTFTTILDPNRQIRGIVQSFPRLPPEQDGQINLESMDQDVKAPYEVLINEVKGVFESAQRRHPEWVLPSLRFRDRSQFLHMIETHKRQAQHHIRGATSSYTILSN